MQTLTKYKSLQAFVINIASVSNAVALAFFMIATASGYKLPGGAWMVYLISPIALVGLIYNFFVFNRVNGRLPYMATYFALVFILLQFFVVIVFTGGFNSQYYAAWLLLLTISCCLSIRAFYINAAIALGSFVMLTFLMVPQGQGWSFNFVALALNGLAVFFGALLALAFQNFKQAAQTADRITNQLDSTKFSEKLMLASIADAVVGVDNKRKIVLFNSAAEDMTGWDAQSANDIFYTNVLKLKDANGNDVTNANDPFLQVFEQKSTLTTDSFHILDKEHNKISLSLSIAPTVDVNNEISGAIAVLHDISEQKAVQRERNEFVSTASHEMRTPVAAIEGYISMANNSNLATIDDRAHSYLEKAHQSALHLGKLFQDLLSVTKIEDQRLNDTRQVFNLSDLVTQVANEMEMVARKKNLQLFTHIGGSSNHHETVIAPVYNVRADAERIREVLTNLVDNAIKYTASGSVDIELDGNRNFVTVKVRDTGMGIGLEDQKHMFEKFYRVNNSMTREIGGTGLGLYIARSLIELYGGQIKVESKPGAGSSFIFSLPLVKNA
ncbi:PAS domain-containing protein [Candidatus Saccharibacteria bacterium]|nr:PAS domain-containing protein [Candidatus Saccharibacteria bacterium]